jgi:hypothetical protein
MLALVFYPTALAPRHPDMCSNFGWLLFTIYYNNDNINKFNDTNTNTNGVSLHFINHIMPFSSKTENTIISYDINNIEKDIAAEKATRLKVKSENQKEKYRTRHHYPLPLPPPFSKNSNCWFSRFLSNIHADDTEESSNSINWQNIYKLYL